MNEITVSKDRLKNEDNFRESRAYYNENNYFGIFVTYIS